MSQESENRRIRGMAFDFKTVTSIDYQNPGHHPLVRTVYKEPRHAERKQQSVVVNHVETMSPYSNQRGVPFGLFIKKNAILHENPRDVVMPTTKPVSEDEDIEKVRHTRTPLVISPQVAIDRTDATSYKIITDDIYCSESMKAVRESGHLKRFPMEAPLIGKYSATNPVTLPKYDVDYVSPEWRMDSVSWDRHQPREICDPTKEYWVHFDRNRDAFFWQTIKRNPEMQQSAKSRTSTVPFAASDKKLSRTS